MYLLQQCLLQLDEVEHSLDTMLKRDIDSISELFEYIEHCSQETRELRTKLDLLNFYTPSDDVCDDDYDGGRSSYR